MGIGIRMNSAGQRQRIGVAGPWRSSRALLSVMNRSRPGRLDPGQIINLLEDLQEKFNLTYLFIAMTWLWSGISVIESRLCT